MWEAKIEYEYTITGEMGGMTHDGTITKSNYTEQPNISENDAEEMAKDQIPNYRILSPYEQSKYIIEILDIDIHEIKFDDPSTGENVADQANDKNAAEGTDDIQTSTDPSVNGLANASSGEVSITTIEEVANAFGSHVAWDPRLYRRDEFFEIEQSDATNGENATPVVIRAPFASNTIATAFSDLSNIADARVIQALIAAKRIAADSEIGKLFGAGTKAPSKTSEGSETANAGKGAAPEVKNALDSDKFITHSTVDVESNPNLWGSQSLINPYSVTKLMGGIDRGSDGLITYLYDIRDRRRFYGIGNTGDDPLAVSNPSVTQLIKWSNADQWGRTPYSFQDFVYCKYFGLIPNNRLITLRRYTVPTYDNLQFENMFGDQETKTKDNTGTTQTAKQNDKTIEPPKNKIFSPHAYVVTWFGGETGNSLNSLMSFTTGINWEDAKADIWGVTGNDGESKQAVIDKMLGDGGRHLDLMGTAENSTLTNAMQGTSFITSKIVSFAKLNMAMNNSVGMSQKAYEHLRGANVDPYNATYRNRVKGPINRIDSVKKRAAGIEFSQSLNIVCEYRSKAIGGINPKAALLDILGNCLEMVSPHAVFWGGGHHFQVTPQLYPFRDGGWRDSFMARIYEGKFLGNDGAIATALSGFKDVGKNESGVFNFDTAKGVLDQMGGGIMKAIGSALGSISDIFGGVGFLDKLSESASGNGNDQLNSEQAKAAKSKFQTLLGNIKSMWQSEVITQTILPNIQVAGNILVGEPVGEWHLTIGNPLNPIMVIGNLICKSMKVDWEEELGPDDFPIGFKVTYTLEHAMARDSDAIQSMFNRGMGKFYTLPDYISTSSDRVTYVDKFTKDAGTGDVGTITYKNSGSEARKIAGKMADQQYRIPSGNKNVSNHGNPNTQLITKYNMINVGPSRSVQSLRNDTAVNIGNISRIRSLASTRKLTNN